MAGLRKASAYSKKYARPYTRTSGKKKKAFIKAVPQSKIVKFNMGNQKAYNEGKLPFILTLVAEEKVQMRDNSLESCRMMLNKSLDKAMPGNYYLEIKVFPHHILRENKTAAGAGADRLSSGMKHSFGITIGRAAILNKGKTIFLISCPNEKTAREVRKIMTKTKSKIPCKTKIVLKKNR